MLLLIEQNILKGSSDKQVSDSFHLIMSNSEVVDTVTAPAAGAGDVGIINGSHETILSEEITIAKKRRNDDDNDEVSVWPSIRKSVARMIPKRELTFWGSK